MFKGKEINNTKTYKDKIAKYFKGFIIIFNPKVYVNSNNLQPAQVVRGTLDQSVPPD
jgi:hypothetical protein